MRKHPVKDYKIVDAFLHIIKSFFAVMADIYMKALLFQTEGNSFAEFSVVFYH